MLEYFYFSVNKAFKDYSYDVREITEKEFKQSDSEFLVKFWEDSDSEGRPKIGYWSCFPKMEISYKKDKPTTFELNGITFSSYQKGSACINSTSFSAMHIIYIECKDHNGKYYDIDIHEKGYTPINYVRNFFSYITKLINMPNIETFELYIKYKSLEKENITNRLSVLKEIESSVRKSNCENAFKLHMMDECEIELEALKKTFQNLKLEDLWRFK